jgi:hypothetical protein
MMQPTNIPVAPPAKLELAVNLAQLLVNAEATSAADGKHKTLSGDGELRDIRLVSPDSSYRI